MAYKFYPKQHFETVCLVCKLKSSLKDQWPCGGSMINDFHSQRERSELISLPDLLPPLPPETELGAEVFPYGRERYPQSWMPALQLISTVLATLLPLFCSWRKVIAWKTKWWWFWWETGLWGDCILSMMEIKVINHRNKNS